MMLATMIVIVNGIVMMKPQAGVDDSKAMIYCDDLKSERNKAIKIIC